MNFPAEILQIVNISLRRRTRGATYQQQNFLLEVASDDIYASEMRLTFHLPKVFEFSAKP